MTVAEKVIEIIAGVFNEEIAPATSFASLDADELDIMEIEMAIEDDLNITLPEDIGIPARVADLIALVEARANA